MAENPLDGATPAPSNAEAPQAAETALARFERERISRRRALAKLGFSAGAAVLAALSVDDLARMASRELARRGAGNRVADKVAREFRAAGVAFADNPSVSNILPGCNGCGNCSPSYFTKCAGCYFWCGGSQPSLNNLPPDCQGTNINCEKCNGAYYQACLAMCAAQYGTGSGLGACTAACDALSTTCEMACGEDDDPNAGKNCGNCWVKSGKV